MVSFNLADSELGFCEALRYLGVSIIWNKCICHRAVAMNIEYLVQYVLHIHVFAILSVNVFVWFHGSIHV